jgi:hypothetical protein
MSKKRWRCSYGTASKRSLAQRAWQELRKRPVATGKAGPGRGKAGSKAGPAFTDAPTLRELGISKKLPAPKRGAAGPGRKKLGSKAGPGFSHGGRSLKELGVSKRRSARSKRLAAIFPRPTQAEPRRAGPLFAPPVTLRRATGLRTKPARPSVTPRHPHTFWGEERVWFT